MLLGFMWLEVLFSATLAYAGWPTGNGQPNPYQTQQTVPSGSNNNGYGSNSGYGNQGGINQGYGQNNNNNQGYAANNIPNTGYTTSNNNMKPMQMGYGQTQGVGYGQNGMLLNNNNNFNGGYAVNSNDVDSDEKNGNFVGYAVNAGNNFDNNNQGKKPYQMSVPVNVYNLNGDSEESSEENGQQKKSFSRRTNFGGNNKFSFQGNQNANNNGFNKQTNNNVPTGYGQNQQGLSFNGYNQMMPTNQGYFPANNNFNNNNNNNKGRNNNNNPFGIVESRGYNFDNNQDSSSEEDSRETNKGRVNNNGFNIDNGGKLQIPFIHQYPQNPHSGFTGYYDSHFIENGNNNGRNSDSNESNGRRSDENSNDNSRDNSRDDDSRSNENSRQDMRYDTGNPTMMYYYKSTSCYQCAYTPPKKFQAKKVKKINRGGYGDEDDSESEEHGYDNVQTLSKSVTIQTRGGWDKCLGPFDNFQAKKFGIDVWDCHGNCYVRRDVNGDVFRGCYKGEYDVDPTMLGCHFQAGAVYCFCEGDKCNNGPPPPPAPNGHD